MANTFTDDVLREAIEEAGYYPALVTDSLATSLAGERVESFVVHHEPHFDQDQLRRHVSVLVLTPTRLVVGHTDEYPPDHAHERPYATATTEAVPLERVSSVVISRTVEQPDSYTAGDAALDVVVTVGWGAMARVDLEPATCVDPTCEADHGYQGAITSDDFTLRVSHEADGTQRVAEMLTFARALSGATVGNS